MSLFNSLFGNMEFESSTEKRKMEMFFNIYMEKIPENFYKNQFDLARDNTGTDFTSWVVLLSHPPFKSWVSQQISLIVDASTNKALGGDTTVDKESLSLLRLRKEVIDTENKAEKPILIVIPESLFFRDTTKEEK